MMNRWRALLALFFLFLSVCFFPIAHLCATAEAAPVSVATGTITTDFVFKAGQTYLVSGPTVMTGTVTIEGDAIIKFDDAASGASLDISNPVFKTTSSSWAIFTSKHDNTVGEVISGSTGSPVVSQYANALTLGSTALRFVEIRYAGTGISFQGSGSFTLQDSKFFAVGTPLSALADTAATTVNINNVLISTGSLGPSFLDDGVNALTVNISNLTMLNIDGVGLGATLTAPGSTLSVTDSLFMDIGGVAVFSGTPPNTEDYNAFYLTPQNGTGPNDLVLTSDPLLPDFFISQTSPLINAGSKTSADAGLYHYTTNVDKTREANTTVDIGYHIPPDLNSFSILATNSVWLKKNSMSTGNIGVNGVTADPWVNSQAQLVVGKNVVIPPEISLFADSIKIKKNAVVNGGVFTNQLTNKGIINGPIANPLALPLFDVLPVFRSAVIGVGANDIEVANGQEVILAPGEYGDITVKKNGNLKFSGGVYHIRSIFAKKNSSLSFEGASEIRIQQTLRTKKAVFVGPAAGSSLNADDIQFFVEGADDGSTPRTAKFGQNNTVTAHLNVPNGTIWLKKGTVASGAFFGKNVIVGQNTDVSEETGAVTPEVAAPIITPNGGSFSGSVSVNLSTITTGASIFYTLDGTTPTSSSTLFTGPFNLTANATVNVIAVRNGFIDSAETSAVFVVSLEQVAVPDVVGLTQGSATTAITGAGLVLGTVTTQNSASVPAGSVISQTPIGGTSVAPNSAVNIVVSLGPAQVTVPDVVGLTQGSATTAITSAGLVLGAVTTQISASVPAGSVISQTPASGISVATGSAVNIVVSSGPPPPPTIADFNPKSVPIGSLINLTGTNLAPNGFTTAQVTLNQQGGGTTQAPVASSNATTISFTVPPGAGTGPVSVTVAGQSVTSSQTLTIEPSSDFSISAGPLSANLIRGQSVIYVVALASNTGFSQLAALSVNGLPTGVTATFSPQQITAGQTSKLTLTAPIGQAIGSSILSVSATATVDGINLQNSANVTLDIQPITTSFLGQTVVDDTVQTPLANVTISFLGKDNTGSATGCVGQTVSDAAGNFSFTNLPVECTGNQLIRYDGLTASNEGTYAGVDLNYTIVADQVTVSPVLVHLPRIDNAETVLVQQNVLFDQFFTFDTIPNLEITVYAGTTLTRVDGSQPDPFPLTAIKVPVDRLPEVMPVSTEFIEAFIVAFQPANATASQPVAVTFPNVLNSPPGTNMPLSTLDPTVGQMVEYGTGTVSPNGTKIVPDLDPANPGQRFGIVNFDWHGPRDNRALAGNNPENPSPECEKNKASTKNPVDLSSGIETIRNTDISLGGLRGGVSIQRVYRTLSQQIGPFGIGGSHNYAFQLDKNLPQFTALINLIMPDGNRFPFSLKAPGIYTNITVCKLRGAVLTVANNGESDLRWKNGTVFHFIPSTAALGSLLDTITDANGNVVTLVRGVAQLPGRITEIIDPVGRKLTLTYEGEIITSVTDPLGRSVVYTYDSIAGTTLETVTDPLGGVTRYEYSAADRLTKVTDARGVVVVENVYDASGRVIQQTHADTGVLNIAYTLTNPGAGPASPVASTTVTDPLGNQTTYRFNPQGYLIDVTDPLGKVRIFDREPGTNLLLAVRGTGQCDVCRNPAGGDVSFTYDANGNIITLTDALGNATTFAYEPVFNKVSSVTDSLNNTTSMTYDASGNLLTITDAGNNTTTFTYDPNGLLLTLTDPSTAQSIFAYDGFGNLVTITDALSNITRILYDVVSRPILTIDALGRRTTRNFDDLDRIIDQTDARGATTRFTYDTISNLLSVTDARNNTTSFAYDVINRQQARTDSLGNVDSRIYDLNGNLTNFTDRRGQVSLFTYDPLDRLVNESYADGSNVTRSYDSNNRLIQAVDSTSGAFSRAYDLTGRLLSEIGPNGAVTYTRDVLGRASQRQVVGQNPVGYTYDPVGNQESVTSPTASVTFAYDNLNRVINEARINGVDTDYTYDPLNRLLTLIHSNGSTVLDNQSYVYDAVGNISRKTVDVAQPLVTQASVNAHDTLSNRLSQQGVTTYTHDNNGNRLTETDPDGITTYVWDARNRLQSLTQPTGETKTFKYDFSGNLIEEIVPGNSRTYVLDELTNIAQLTDSSGQQLSVLTGQTIDQHLAVTDDGGTSNYGLIDQINSTTQIVDDSGTSQGQSFNEPFGQTTTAGVAHPFRFTGRVQVADDIYYYRARYYDTNSGRFISEDPIGFSGGDVNLYRYVFNNPENFTDPSGLLLGGLVAKFLRPFTGQTVEEATVAGLFSDAVIGAATLTSRDKIPCIDGPFGNLIDAIQLTSGVQTISLSTALAFSLGGAGATISAVGAAAVFPIALAGLGGVEIGFAINSLIERGLGQSLGSHIFDITHN